MSTTFEVFLLFFLSQNEASNVDNTFECRTPLIFAKLLSHDIQTLDLNNRKLNLKFWS